MPDERTRQLRAGFDLASEGYDSDPMSFFGYYGEALAEFSRATPGETALDLCCGTGAVSLPLASLVTASGHVTGVDVSPGMLGRAIAKAADADITWTEFVEADVAQFEADREFDLATCGFSVQFFQDMSVPMSKMVGAVRPGGRIAISMWAEGFIEEHRNVLARDLSKVRSDIEMSQSGSSIKDEQELTDLLARSGLAEIAVEHVDYRHHLAGAEAWWALLMNAGYRRHLERLSESELAEFRELHMASMRDMEDANGEIVLHMPANLGLGFVPS